MAPGGVHQDTEAREVMEAKVPLMIVQFQQDVFCNPGAYPHWYGQILSGVEGGRAERSFFFLNLPGNHDDCEELATKSQWNKYGLPLQLLWRGFWAGVTGQ